MNGNSRITTRKTRIVEYRLSRNRFDLSVTGSVHRAGRERGMADCAETGQHEREKERERKKLLCCMRENRAK